MENSRLMQLTRRVDIQRAVRRIDPNNLRSIALLQRLGFRQSGRAERTWCIGGEWADSVYFELARPAD